MRNLIFFLFILICTIPCYCKNSEGEKSLLFGKQQFNSGNYEKAKEFFAASINIDPDLIEAYEYRAKTAEKLGLQSLNGDINFYRSRILTLKEKAYTANFGLACTYLAKIASDPQAKSMASEELATVIEKDEKGPFGKRAQELMLEYKLTEEKQGFSFASIMSLYKEYELIPLLLIPGIGIIALILLIFIISYPRERLLSTLATVIIVILIYCIATMATIFGFGRNTVIGKSIRNGPSMTGGIHGGK